MSLYSQNRHASAAQRLRPLIIQERNEQTHARAAQEREDNIVRRRPRLVESTRLVLVADHDGTLVESEFSVEEADQLQNYPGWEIVELGMTVVHRVRTNGGPWSTRRMSPSTACYMVRYLCNVGYIRH